MRLCAIGHLDPILTKDCGRLSTAWSMRLYRELTAQGLKASTMDCCFNYLSKTAGNGVHGVAGVHVADLIGVVDTSSGSIEVDMEAYRRSLQAFPIPREHVRAKNIQMHHCWRMKWASCVQVGELRIDWPLVWPTRRVCCRVESLKGRCETS